MKVNLSLIIAIRFTKGAIYIIGGDRNSIKVELKNYSCRAMFNVKISNTIKENTKKKKTQIPPNFPLTLKKI